MAHIRQKLGAQAGGFERQILRAGHLLLGALSQRDRGCALVSNDCIAPA